MSLNELIIPQKITGDGKVIDIQIYSFADASNEAYGCYIYLRSTNSEGVHNFNNLNIKLFNMRKIESRATQSHIVAAVRTMCRSTIIKISK